MGIVIVYMCMIEDIVLFMCPTERGTHSAFLKHQNVHVNFVGSQCLSCGTRIKLFEERNYYMMNLIKSKVGIWYDLLFCRANILIIIQCFIITKIVRT